MTRTDLASRVDRLRADRTPYVLATVVRAERPTSARAGDRALVLGDGTIEGFVGGVCAESTVRVQGLRLLRTGESTLLRITPDPGGTGGTGEPAGTPGLVTVANTCLSGGTLEIFLEAVIPPPYVWVFGAAPVAQALGTVGAALGYTVDTTTDPTAPIPADATAVVVAAHGRDEEPVLTTALRAGVPYVGLVASPRRGGAVLSALDLTDAERGRVHTPAGLDLGARTAAEIALSVFAEIIQTRPAPQQASVSSAISPAVSPAISPATQGVAPVEEALDPVCGMTVAVSTASLWLEHDGVVRYFCGPGCRQAFAADPGRYTA